MSGRKLDAGQRSIREFFRSPASVSQSPSAAVELTATDAAPAPVTPLSSPARPPAGIPLFGPSPTDSASPYALHPTPSAMSATTQYWVEDDVNAVIADDASSAAGAATVAVCALPRSAKMSEDALTPMDVLPIPVGPAHVDIDIERATRDALQQGLLLLPHYDEKRWSHVIAALEIGVGSRDALLRTIHTVIATGRPRGQPAFNTDALRSFLDALPADQAQRLYTQTLPFMVRLVHIMPALCPKTLPLLRRGRAGSVQLRQDQAACLLACAFFCVYDDDAYRERRPVDTYGIADDATDTTHRLPSINFYGLFHRRRDEHKPCLAEKLRCIVHYFERRSETLPTGLLVFERRVLEPADTVDWRRTSAVFAAGLSAREQGTIEDDGTNCLQADFAHKLIGGGVLRRGCVQEEIRFVICPELILTRLVTEELMDNEVLLLAGAERFCAYRGYGDSFQFTGPYVDPSACDERGVRTTAIVAFDAVDFSRDPAAQFRPRAMLRELTKAYAAFRRAPGDAAVPVATGNWGCGAFKGDVELKAVLQLMAAAQAGRDLVYFTFGNRLSSRLEALHAGLRSRRATVARVWQVLHDYGRERACGAGTHRRGVFEYLLDVL